MSPSSLSSSLYWIACAVTLAACGGGSGAAGDGGLLGNKDSSGAASSGVAGSKTIGSLTSADTKAICDWTASLYGGYGGEVTCDDGAGFIMTITGPKDLAECLAKAATVPSTCKSTVAQAEACTRALSTCDESDDAAAAAACTAMMTCVN
jgi:hypothetical protein